MHVSPLERFKMEESAIRKYAKLMQELGLTSMEINECGTVIRLERSAEICSPATFEKAEAVDPDSNTADDLFDLRSPMVGVFYSSPAENAAPFVQVGDTVQKGDVLCIIESMKLMNEIVAEHDGTIAEICVENNQTVDYGQVLFRCRKAQK